MRVRIDEKFSQTIKLSPDGASAFARAAGDHNPLHHDAEFAAATRYKRPLASGTQTTARKWSSIAPANQRSADVGRSSFNRQTIIAPQPKYVAS